MNLVCAGSCAALISVQMLTTTTENTGRRIIMPGDRGRSGAAEKGDVDGDGRERSIREIV